MSFLVASGHVQVDANTGDAKDEIRDLIQAMGGISPSARASADALKDLGRRAATSGQSLGRLATKAQQTERALSQLRAVAGDIQVTADLDDQTTSGLAAVSAAIRDLKAESPIRIEVEFDGQAAGGLAQLRAEAQDIRVVVDIDDQTEGGATAVRAALQDLRAQGPVRLDVTVDAQLGEITGAAQAMRDLRGNARDAGQAFTTLATRAAAAAIALNAVQNAAQDASRALRTLRGRAAAASAAMQELRDSSARTASALRQIATRSAAADDNLNTLSTRTRTLRSDMDDLDGSVRRAGGGMRTLRGNLGGGGSGGSSGDAGSMLEKLKAAAISLVPALIPVAAAMVPIAASAAAAGVAIGAFGAAAAGQVKSMTEAAQAEAKYDKAVKEHGRTSEEAAKAQMAYANTVKDMPPATRQAAAAFSVLKDQYKDWSKALAADTMPVVTKSMAVFGALLPRLTPMVKGASVELDRMMNVLGGAVQTDGFKRFMDSFAKFSSDVLSKATTGMVKFSQALDSGAVGSDVSKFMDYVRSNGPLVGDTLGNLARAAARLLVAGSDAGVGMLQLVNALAKLVNAIPTSVLSTILQLYAGMKLLKIGMAGVAAVTTSSAIARLGAYFQLMRTAGVGTTLRATAASMTTMQKAAGALGILGAVAVGINALAEKARGAPPDVDRLTSSLKTLSATGKWTGELKATFGDMDGFVSKLGKLKNESAAMEKAKPFLAFSGLGPFADTAVTKLDDLVRGTKSLGATKDDFKSFDQALAAMATNGYAKQAAEQFDDMKAAWLGSGRSLKEFNSVFPDYRSAVGGLKAEQKLAADGMGLFGQQAVDTKTKLDAQKASADGLRSSIQALNDVNRAALGGMIGFEAAIDATAKAAKENKGSLHMVNGELDLNSPKAQAAATALADLAAKTDEATAKAREGGASWEKVNGIYSRGRSNLVDYARQMGLSKTEAEQFARSVLKIPDSKALRLKMNAEDAKGDLDAFISKVKGAPSSKSVTMKALTKTAEGILEDLGFKVKRMPDGSVTISAKTGTALANIGAVQRARDNLQSKSITLTTYSRFVNVGPNPGKQFGRLASGGRVPGYASGGDVQSFPGGGYVDGPGTPTSDSILAVMGSGAAARVSRTEYVVKAAAVEKYGVPFMDAVNSGRLRLPGYAKGGKLTAKQKAAAEKKKRAADAEKQRQKEGKSALTSDVTFTTGGKLAGYKNTETVHDLGMPDSVSSLVSSVNSYLSNIKKAFTGKTESALVSKMTASGKALLDNQKKLEANNKALDAAKTTLDDLKGKFDSLKSSVSSSLVGFGNITKIGKYGTSADTLIKQLTSDTTRTTEFSKQLEALKGKGLNATAISDIAAAGVTGGGMATAQSLLNASPDQIKQINELQAQLQKSADAAGTTAANAMYGAGLHAAEGLVAGLTAKQKAIESTMMAIAKSMEAAIKKALGIKSPSKVMEPIGDFAFQGVEQGWVKRQAAGNTLISGSTAGIRTKPSYIRAVAPAASSPAGSGVVVNLTPTFNTMTLPGPAERRSFVRAMVKDINDELLDYQKARRR
ncbi:phage tail protein [Streptomyces sp. NPDC055817]